MGVALQDFHSIAVCNIFKTHSICCQNLVSHFNTILFCQATRVQPNQQTKQINNLDFAAYDRDYKARNS